MCYHGTWMTRGYSSLQGVGIVIEAHTGYIVDGYICSKYCHACTYWNNKAKQDRTISGKYLKWKNKHVTRTSMNLRGKESTAAVASWQTSLEKKLRYVVSVRDGDSAAHNAACSLNNGDDPYGPDYPVRKEECLNHDSKRLGTRLRALKKKKLAEPVS